MAPFKGFTGNLNKGTSKSFRGFTGGTEKFKEREKARSQYFDNRPDVSKDRLDRRIAQAQELEDFKDTLKIAEGTTNLYQASKPVFDTDPSSPTFGKYVTKTLADKEIELAKKYGPTFSEIAGDMGYAVGSMAKGAAEKGIGLFAILKGVSDKFSNDADKNYDNLNDVSKQIADNPNKYPLTSSGLSSLDAVNSSKNLALEAKRDLQNLQKFAVAADARGVLGIDTNRLDSFVNEPVGTFGEGLTKLPAPEISVETKSDDYVESGQLKEDLQKSGIITVDDPSTQEPLPDSTIVPGEEQFGTTIGDLKRVMKEQGFDDLQIQSTVNQVTQQILSGNFTGDVEVETGSTTRGSELPNAPGSSSSTGTQVTQYNNPLNLTDVGQAGATGETYGKGFAVFPDAETGIMAAKNDLKIKTDRYDGDVEKIIGEFAPRSDNPDSFDNYVNFVKQGVGDRVDAGEEDELLKRFIRFENKPDVADRYLAMVAEGGLMDKKMYGGIIGSKR